MKDDNKFGIQEAHGNIQWTKKKPLVMQTQIRMPYYTNRKNYWYIYIFFKRALVSSQKKLGTLPSFKVIKYLHQI